MKNKLFHFLFDTRQGFAVWLVFGSAALTFLLGGGFSLITKNFWFTCQYCFFLFFAFPCVSALLLLLTNIEEDLSFGFGAGLYYGTLGAAAVTEYLNWHMGDTDRLFLGFIVAALACRIVYLQRYK